MKPNSNRPASVLSSIATAMLVASALHAATASAATFQFRQPVMGIVASPTSQAQQTAAEILFALTGGPALPAGEVSLPYSYDLNQLLQVSGDPAYNASSVKWELPSGTLPAGLNLGSNGVISGTPTTKDTTGASFQVLATYKTKTGQQAYTIVVNGAVLHVTQISANGNHTCAVTPEGGAKCWGFNGSGQLGNNSTTNSSVPVAVSGLTSGVVSISAGTTYSCAVTSVGGAKCWGFNGTGQLGNNSTTTSLVPVNVSGLTSGVASLAAGVSFTCAVTTSSGAKCWGQNGSYGMLGNNSTTDSSVPVNVSGLTTGVASVTVGQYHACALTSTGGVKCWGHNGFYQLGDYSTTTGLFPGDVFGLTSGVASISAGTYHTCAVTTAGGVKCWGSNGAGQLGDGTQNTQMAPVGVSGLTSGVSRISGGASHTCALTTAGATVCWGANTVGQLGDGTLVNRFTPVGVSGLESGVVSIDVGGNHTCAVTTAGSTKCWGYNNKGQLGNNSLVNSTVPVGVLP